MGRRGGEEGLLGIVQAQGSEPRRAGVVQAAPKYSVRIWPECLRGEGPVASW